MTPELHSVLSDWLADATSSEPSTRVRVNGLCHYCVWDNITCLRPEKIIEEFKELLAADFGQCIDYPFDYDSRSEYEDEIGRRHLNPRRLAWVRKVLS